MTISFVGTAVQNSGSGTSGTATLTVSTPGNGIAVMVNANVAVSSVTESGGVTRIAVKGQACSDAPTFSGNIYFFPNVTGGSHTVTANFGSSASWCIAVQEVAGMFTPTVDKTAGNGAYTATTNTGSTGTLAQAVELALAVVQNCNSNFASTANPAGWTILSSSTFAGPSGFSFAGLVTSATTALNPTWTTTGGNYEAANAIGTLIPGTAPPAATLTSPAPSGTIATATTANVGATTDTSGGTGYCVVTTSSLSGVTAAQIKAGQNAAGSTSGVQSGTTSVSATGSFTIPVTGLVASTVYNYAVVETTAGGDSNIVSGTFTTAPPPPSVSGLSTTTPKAGQSITITGTAFNSTQSGGSVAIGGVAQTVTAWSNTSITITVVQGTLLYGATTLTVTNGVTGSQSTGTACTLTPATGWSYIVVGTPDPVTSERVTATPVDIATGDQIAWGNIQGTGSLTINTDGSWIADPGVTAFDYMVGTPGSGYGSVQTDTLGASVSVKNGVVHTYSIKASSDTKFYSQYPAGNHP